MKSRYPVGMINFIQRSILSHAILISDSIWFFNMLIMSWDIFRRETFLVLKDHGKRRKILKTKAKKRQIIWWKRNSKTGVINHVLQTNENIDAS